MIETFGIPDYQPEAFYSTDEIRSSVGAALSELVGVTFDGAWLMWDFGTDEWVEDAPIVICLADRQLEICFGDAEEIFVSIDEIDRSKPLAWFDERNRPYQWVNNPTAAFQSLSFRRLERFGIGETGWASGGVASFQPSSIELDLGDAHLALVRTETGGELRFEPPTSTDRFRVVWF